MTNLFPSQKPFLLTFPPLLLESEGPSQGPPILFHKESQYDRLPSCL